MLVSIITPVFNSGNLLLELYHNLQLQGQSFEWILIDDGSTDPRTLEILEEIESNFSSAKLVRQVNLGAPRARNKGIEVSKGDFLKFLDADDLLSDDHVGIQITSLNSQSEMTEVMVVSPFIEFRDFGDQKERTKVEPLNSKFFEDPVLNSLRSFIFHHSGCLFSRDLVLNVMWDTELKAFQDLDFLWRILLLEPEIVLENNAYFIYREHNYTGRITSSKSEGKWFSRFDALAKLYGTLHNSRNQKKYKRHFELSFNVLIANSLLENKQITRALIRKKEELTGYGFSTNLFWRIFISQVRRFL